MTAFRNTAIVHPGVVWKSDPRLGDFVIIGEPARGRQPGSAVTSIGVDAEIRSHSVIYDGNRIGDRFQTGHGVLVREDNVIGDDVSIGTGSVVEHHIRIGNGVRLHSNVFIPEFSVLEDCCWIGPNVVVTNSKYPQSPSAKTELMGAYIESGAKIGANATLLPGVRIGRDCVIGAGAVVTKDVPPGAVMVGNPARQIKHVASLPYGAAA
jgi:acetyltransferase-like isoleucine patch superfamily enzyme